MKELEHDEYIDIEAYAKEGKPIPPGRFYKIRVDREHFTFQQQHVTGREILTKAGKLPIEQYRLDQKLKGGTTKKVELNESVDLTTPGVERFMTLRLDQTEG